MDTANDSNRPCEHRLDQQLARLRKIDGVDSVQRVQLRLRHTVRAERRQVAWALIGAAVAAAATLVFIHQRDPVGYALAVVTAALLLTAWRCSGRAIGLMALGNDRSLIAAWWVELKRQSRTTLVVGPSVATLFTILTTWVLWRHGLATKSIVYLVVAAAIWLFVVYHLLVTWPILKRERDLVEAASRELDGDAA